MRAQGEGNPVCSCLLPFSEFGFCLWSIPVHAAKFFRNAEKCIENKTRLTSLCKPKSDLQEGKVFWWSLGPWEMDLHLSSLLSPWRRRKKSPNPQIFYLAPQDPSRSLPRDHKFFPDCHHCSWTLVQHVGRVSFVPPQHRGHATNNLRDHFSCYMTLNILYLKKKKSTPLGIK